MTTSTRSKRQLSTLHFLSRHKPLRKTLSWVTEPESPGRDSLLGSAKRARPALMATIGWIWPLLNLCVRSHDSRKLSQCLPDATRTDDKRN